MSGRPSGGAGSGPSPARSAAALGEAADGRARQLEPAGAGLRSAVADAGTDAHDASSPTGRLINEIIAARAVEVEYQPVFDVDNKQVVGFEALTRGPDGPLRSPLHLFAAARLVGRLGELDWICRAVALRGLLEAELHPAISLFVNVEPDSLIEPCPEDLLETIWEAENRLRIMIDLTGRTLSRYPREVLETVRRARAARWGVALSHVEFSAAGLALLPTIEPDVVKLDHPLLATGQGHVSAAITGALSEAERTGAALVVQRVEDESAAVVARSIGATYQQGRLFAPEGRLPKHLPTPKAPLQIRRREPQPAATPWHILTNAGAYQSGQVPQEGLDHLLRTFTSQAGLAEHAPVVALVIPDAGTIPVGNVALYQMLLERSPLVLLLGPDVSSWSDWRVRAADLPDGHPLRGQVCFVTLSPQTATAVVARPTPGRSGKEPTWDIAISQNHEGARQVVRHLLDTLDNLAGGVLHRQAMA